MLDRIKNEPSLLTGLVLAIMAFFGLNPETQRAVGNVLPVLAIAIPLAATAILRNFVRPVRKDAPGVS